MKDEPATSQTTTYANGDLDNAEKMQSLHASDATWTPDKTIRERDLVSALISLRAWVLNMANSVEDIGELPARKRVIEAARLAERMRCAVVAPNLVELCK